MTTRPAKYPARPESLAPAPCAVGLLERGHSDLRFLGMRVYTATLWVDARFAPERYWASPIGLDVRYHRALKGELLVERSLVEMRRQAPVSIEQNVLWRARLQSALPDVKAGERLCAHHDGSGNVTFWGGDTLLTTLNDPEFARLFFGIWLAPTCAVPSVRQGLLS